MPNSYTTNTRMALPGIDGLNKDADLAANFTFLDAVNAIGGLPVTALESPSETLHIQVAAGTFVDSTGAIQTYAGSASTAVVTAATNYVYLTDGGTLTVNQSGFPTGTTPYIPLAIVVTETNDIKTITDSRLVARAATAAANSNLKLAGGTLADGANIAVGSTTGTEIGTAATQKLGFYGATPVVQPSGASQASLTAATGTASTTISDVGGSFSQTTLNNNFKSIVTLLNAIQAALVSEGLIKGSA